jgi:tRNA 5-methylaminomethyl-2-thiouridine biosynthesis bifunctional protein
MLCGRFGGAGVASNSPERRAIVIGAGLAGSAVSERLASRGWAVTLLERNAGPAQGASGNHAGAFHPLVTRDDNFMARLARASFLYGLHRWRTLDGLEWSECGVLQMPRTDEEDAAQRRALGELGYPSDYAEHLEKDEAARRTGVPLAAGGIWFQHGGWLRPRSLVQALLGKAQADMRFDTEVASLQRSATGWVALDKAGGRLAEAPTVVLANAQDAERLARVPETSLRTVRGQVSYLPGDECPPTRSVLLRGGMLIPAIDGIAVAGASFDFDDDDPDPRTDSHAGNLERLARILPDLRFDPATLAGRVGFRSVPQGRLPLVGPFPDKPGLHAAFGYASRGILWSALMAELLACQLEGDPLPVELRLAQAVDPGRFALRVRRRAGSPGSRP